MFFNKVTSIFYESKISQNVLLCRLGLRNEINANN
ncbi:hypothetical protein SAMN06298216_3803 [Spirosomataceae bacterium TFI 002]|nr:hypothetical protein SAMN06298216_3803 [Spirosomataceae bacterium TFI 002]